MEKPTFIQGQNKPFQELSNHEVFHHEGKILMKGGEGVAYPVSPSTDGGGWIVGSFEPKRAFDRVAPVTTITLPCRK